MIPKMPAPAKAGVADYSDKISCAKSKRIAIVVGSKLSKNALVAGFNYYERIV
jgi:hypothetical protein